MSFQVLDQKGKNFLKLCDNNLNSLELSVIIRESMGLTLGLGLGTKIDSGWT